MHSKSRLQRITAINQTFDGARADSARELDVIGYLDGLLTQCHLPIRDQRDANGDPLTRWHRVSGRYAITIQSGTASVALPNGEMPPYAGIPYGSHARLFLAAVMRHARRYKTRTIPLQGGATRFAEHIGLSVGGEQLQSLADQAVRIATSIWQFGHKKDDGAFHQINTLLCDEFNATINPERGPHGRWSLAAWPTELILSQSVYDRLLQHGTPFDIRALQSLSGNPRAMDIYTFLVSRLWRLPRSKPWRIPLAQFASYFDQATLPDRERMINATRHALQQALAVYPQAADSVSIERDTTVKGRPLCITLKSAKPAVPLLKDE